MNSASSTGKKVDRRTAYTRMTVKDALLELLEEQPFEKITVAALCRQARMSAIMELVRSGSAEDLRRNERLQGPCQRVADDPKYRAIFQDPTLSQTPLKKWLSN